jgi:hypothetical protein
VGFCLGCGVFFTLPTVGVGSTCEGIIEARSRGCVLIGPIVGLSWGMVVNAFLPHSFKSKTRRLIGSIRQWPKGKQMNARTPAPKAKDYSVVPGSSGPRRDFRISVGLREGWDADGRVFDVSEAVRTARAWMKRRVEAGQPALSGMFTRAEVTYAWPRPDGTVGSDREPVALFTGEAVHAYLGHLSDDIIEAMLNELSIELGAALGQERIYVAFADRTWILDAGER